MEGSEIKSFIDTNVFVHWIILKKIKENQPENEEIWKQFKKIRPSFGLVELIKNQTLDDFSFIT